MTAHTHLFDYDRTDSAAEAHRHAYNAAFDALGLAWHWDAATYATLTGHGPQRVRSYLETRHAHLLRAYDADFLVEAIEAAKARCHAGAARIPMPPPAPAGHTFRRVQQAA